MFALGFHKFSKQECSSRCSHALCDLQNKPWTSWHEVLLAACVSSGNCYRFEK